VVNNYVVLEIFGEGKTDIGKAKSSEPELPRTGVVAILVHMLCGCPASMRVKRKPSIFLQGKGWTQKVKFAKRQAFYNKSAGVVFVLDTEGDHKERMDELEKGRNAAHLDFPMAIGVAHPCIETWLLADAKAIKKAMDLKSLPTVSDTPETMPAPQRDRKNNPKIALAIAAEIKKAELSSVDKDRITLEIRDLALICERCPIGFQPFAAEVELRIKPLFAVPLIDGQTL